MLTEIWEMTFEQVYREECSLRMNLEMSEILRAYKHNENNQSKKH